MKNSAIQVALHTLADTLSYWTTCWHTAEADPLAENSTMTDFLYIIYLYLKVQQKENAFFSLVRKVVDRLVKYMQRSWLRNYATSRKIADSWTHEVNGIFKFT
jgi:hypothetical protein